MMTTARERRSIASELSRSFLPSWGAACTSSAGSVGQGIGPAVSATMPRESASERDGISL